MNPAKRHWSGKKYDEEEEKEEEKVEGGGKYTNGLSSKFSKHALSDHEIDEILKDEEGYIGCVCID